MTGNSGRKNVDASFGNSERRFSVLAAELKGNAGRTGKRPRKDAYAASFTERTLTSLGMPTGIARRLAERYHGISPVGAAREMIGYFVRRMNTGHEGHRERMRTLMQDGDIDTFSDVDILEAILSYGIPRKDTRETAQELLSVCGGSLLGVFRAEKSKLMSVSSVTERAADLISLLSVISACTGRNGTVLSTRRDIIEFFTALGLGTERSDTLVAFLDPRFELIALESQDGDRLIDIRKTADSVCKYRARYVVAARNDTSLLPACFNGRDAIIKASDVLEAVGATLLDCFIFTAVGYYSFGAGVKHDGVYVFEPLVAVDGEYGFIEKLADIKLDRIDAALSREKDEQ